MKFVNRYTKHFFVLFQGFSRIFSHFFSRIYFFWFPVIKNKPEPTILNKTEQYVKEKTDLFKMNNNGNSNIETTFYDKEDFFAMIREQNNTIEETWKTRILFENTPRGNIIMYYDAYKQGFAYYSDTNGLPYTVLNVVAMKYVTTFFCRDFFVDNEVLSNEQESKMISIYYREPVKPKDVTTTNNEINTSKGPFAKLKNYNKPVKNTDKQSSNEKSESKDIKDIKNEKKEEEYVRNKFIYLGKMMNFQFMKKEKKVSHLNGFKTNLLDGVVSESQLQKQVLNYKDYKAQTQKK